jgi:hypothetical protein
VACCQSTCYPNSTYNFSSYDCPVSYDHRPEAGAAVVCANGTDCLAKCCAQRMRLLLWSLLPVPIGSFIADSVNSLAHAYASFTPNAQSIAAPPGCSVPPTAPANGTLGTCASVSQAASIVSGASCEVACLPNYAVTAGDLSHICDNGVIKGNATCTPTCDTVSCAALGLEAISGVTGTSICAGGDCIGSCCQRSMRVTKITACAMLWCNVGD